ncbi:MAG: autotransporter domain-containing protein [Desulfobacterales bacterium]|nr:autotransporter domain-containing protein [Desulfobacterales bacterium]
MKKYLLLFTLMLLSVFMVFGSSHAWQGRMAGMGDPYGLVQDESDILIHPAMIMNSFGTRFYTHYRFTYTDVMDLDYKWNFSDPSQSFDYDFKASGDEYQHEALLGSTFNLGSGRMGVFFTYENKNGEYDGKIDQSGTPFPDTDFNLDSDKMDFTLSFLYGFPIDCINIGFEAGLAYHNEENKTVQGVPGTGIKNNVFPVVLFPINWWSNIYPYMIPYDSEYYETFVKASIASELGCAADFGLTLSGGYIFSGDNELDSEGDTVIGYMDTEMDGDVDGWSLGGDFWVRYKVDDSLSLPFLLSASYQKITRDGDDNASIGGFPVFGWDYEHKEVSWSVEAGGGVDIALDDTSKIASGIYYRYLENNNDFMLDIDTPTFLSNTDMDDIPDYNEHRITLKLAYEKEISPVVGFRAGFDCFYGWADWDYKIDTSFLVAGVGYKENVSMDGDLWGIGLTIGGTIKIDPVTLEPFIGAAYQQTDLDGNGTTRFYGGLTDTNIEGDHERDQWLVTTGLSILF